MTKGKVIPGLKLIKHPTMKTYRGNGGTAPPFLISALDGSEWSASRPFRLNTYTHFTVNWAHHRADLDVMEKRKISYPCRESNPDSSAVQPVAQLP
jgi:hypothetical protein